MSGIISEMSSISRAKKSYKVVTPVYEGPLDLLLQLIEKAELDITKLSLALVTDQFLEHIHHIDEGLVEDVSSFLVVASRLIQIKSEALLPRLIQREPGEIDLGEALALQLRTYKRFKEIANLLEQRLTTGQRTYPRYEHVYKMEASFDFIGLDIADLFSIAQFVFLKEDHSAALGTVVTPPKITIREKVYLIADFIRQQKTGYFHDLISNRNERLEIVVTFLALLELIKRQMIAASQDRIFRNIRLEPGDIWDENLMFELEFGE